jgi:DNA-directed RNA polymerase subunit RPC12/RpoP
MTTVYVCGGCGAEMERYEDAEPYRERAEGLCSKCFGSEAAFDRAFSEYELGQYRVVDGPPDMG